MQLEDITQAPDLVMEEEAPAEGEEFMWQIGKQSRQWAKINQVRF
jgi:hypothetical protein